MFELDPMSGGGLGGTGGGELGGVQGDGEKAAGYAFDKSHLDEVSESIVIAGIVRLPVFRDINEIET